MGVQVDSGVGVVRCVIDCMLYLLGNMDVNMNTWFIFNVLPLFFKETMNHILPKIKVLKVAAEICLFFRYSIK